MFSIKRLRTIPKRDGFFLSFEDALRYLFEACSLRAGMKIFFPAFFCMEVAKNLGDFGLDWVPYDLDLDLQVDLRKFSEKLRSEKPDVVIIYHPLGRTSELRDNLDWLSALEPNCLLVEDTADFVTEGLGFIWKSHAIINSLRKVFPIQGSELKYSLPIEKKVNLAQSFSAYRVKALGLFALWRLLLGLSGLDPRIWIWAEKIFEAHNSLIGTSKMAARGFFLDALLSAHLQVRAEKRLELYQCYLREFSNLQLSEAVPIPLAVDPARLRYFTLRVKTTLARRIEFRLRATKFKAGELHFPDSPRCGEWSYLIFPISENISAAEITSLRGLLRAEKLL